MPKSAVGGPAAKTYPFIRTYCQMMGSYPYYVREELQAAGATNAPADAYASKRGPSTANGPDDWLRVSSMDKHGRARMERLAGYNAAELCRQHGEEPAPQHEEAG
jgi:hypothetical protein